MSQARKRLKDLPVETDFLLENEATVPERLRARQRDALERGLDPDVRIADAVAIVEVRLAFRPYGRKNQWPVSNRR